MGKLRWRLGREAVQGVAVVFGETFGAVELMGQEGVVGDA
jgi:hypothetical protein